MEAMWKNADPTEVQQTWGDELSGYEAEDIRMALEAMRFAFQEWPPTLYQFADLCKDARLRRVQTTRVLGYERKKQEIDARVLAEINRLTRNWREQRKGDCRDWARRILQREQQGEKMPVIAISSAREALGLQ